MADIQAFNGIRYDLGHVGSLGDVIAPPYDVIDDAFQDALYKKHPANVVRLILNRSEPGDSEDDRYRRAAKFYKDWRSQGLLFSEARSSLYVYHQEFDYGGQSFCRRGFMARVRLEPFGEGKIYPHEETHSAAKADRLKLINSCRANMSQIFGLYPDSDNAVQNALDANVIDKTPLQATDHLGVVHRMWMADDPTIIAQAVSLMVEKPLFIADGHHRYETALNYRNELAAKGPLDPEHPANFVLMMMIGMGDPGLVVYPTHRLFRGLPEMDSDDLIAKLGDCFTTRIAGEGSDLAEVVWGEVEEQGTIAFHCVADDRWVVASITPEGERRMAEAAPDHSDRWRSLGVSILQTLVLETLLEAHDLPKPGYAHLIDEVAESIDSGQYALTALVMPAGLPEIEAISAKLERMPPKSTYFYPKLLSGLVINPLE